MKTMKKNNSGFGKKLAAIRKAAGLSQKDIADRTGMVQQKVSAAESGNTDNRISTIERIADALGYKVDIIKKDGTTRRMVLPKSKKLEATVNGMHPLITSKANETLRANGMMRVEEFCRDAEGNPVHQWRTLTLGNITRLSINGVTLTFNQ